ncbi:nucleotide exchange factor GrpE [Candidatus Nomurabacteria bacterium]|nr:nucleotide exchange factor GrpE [Candidatus Kaiserbacteria bacterium]MCB9813963.1 nucleotide exchange factor GrpE [Candidatus Nomurabacteria bacterium]
MKNNDDDFETEITNEDGNDIELPELEDIEERTEDKIKKLRQKLSECEEEKKAILDESQRTKADFLNARKRLEDERARDRIRYRKQHVEELLPLCDSFQMAMSNKEAWEKADPAWRVGIEGIHSQLLNILNSYGVKAVSPEGEVFSPHQHEAIGTEDVEDEALHDKIVSVVQKGYEMTTGDTTETIRPARVTTGIKIK